MTKLQIISRLWSHVTDLRMLIREQSKKTLEEIESELDATEYYCRPYADVDDIEAYLEVQLINVNSKMRKNLFYFLTKKGRTFPLVKISFFERY